MNVGEPVRIIEIKEDPVSWPEPQPERVAEPITAPAEEPELVPAP